MFGIGEFKKLMQKLTVRERSFIRWRFGLVKDGKGRSLVKVGKIMGISRGRVRNLER